MYLSLLLLLFVLFDVAGEYNKKIGHEVTTSINA